jgi:hypothetical protein
MLGSVVKVPSDCQPQQLPGIDAEAWGNRPLEPRALEVEFFPMEEVLHERVKIHR